MDSSSSRSEEEKRRQAEIRKQIALLQAQLVDIPGEHNTPSSSSPKQRRPDETLIAPATPSPSELALCVNTFGISYVIVC